MSAQAVDLADSKKCSHCQRWLQARPNFTFGRDPQTGKLSSECMECEGRRKMNDPAYGYDLLLREIGPGALAQSVRAMWSLDDYANLIESNACRYCGSKLTEWGHGHKLDRFDRSHLWTPTNVTPCCQPCTVDRGAFTVAEWKAQRLDQMVKLYGRGNIPWENVLRGRCPPKVKIPNLRDYTAAPPPALAVVPPPAPPAEVDSTYVEDEDYTDAPPAPETSGTPGQPDLAERPAAPQRAKDCGPTEPDHCLIVTLTGDQFAALQKTAATDDEAQIETVASRMLARSLANTLPGDHAGQLLAIADGFVLMGSALEAHYGFQVGPLLDAMRALCVEGRPSAEAFLATLPEKLPPAPQPEHVETAGPAEATRTRQYAADHLPACAIALAELMNENESTTFHARDFAAKLHGWQTGRGIGPVLIALRNRGWIERAELGEWIIQPETLASYLTELAETTTMEAAQ